MTYIGVLVSFVFVNNVIMVELLGEKAFTDVSRDIRTASLFGAVLACVAALTCLVTRVIYHGILAPLGLIYLQTLIFILLITGLTLLLELALDKLACRVPLCVKIKAFLPLMSTNCAVLGITLIAVRSGYSALESLVAGFSAGAGYFFALFLLSTIRDSMRKEWIPKPFQGIPIALISAGLLALTFMAFDEALLKKLVG